MALGKSRPSISLDDVLSKVTEADILSFYFGVKEVPCIINSPIREDKKPSFGFYSNDGKRIFFKDLSTKETGGLFDLLGIKWGMNYSQVLSRVYEDIPMFSKGTIVKATSCNVRTTSNYNKDTNLQCKVREWRDYDEDYWNSYGISIKWLKYANVYPISHKIIVKGTKKYVFGTDKLAYAYVEKKEGKVTLKIYQPLNKDGYKWSNKHDSSVISLWTKIPKSGNKLCICASLKDALCLWANTGIPAIAIQGEGYSMSNTAIEELRKRYFKIYILLDNDKAGLEDGVKLAEQTGFINLVLPDYGAKDISDLYKLLQNKEQFKQIILKLFKHD